MVFGWLKGLSLLGKLGVGAATVATASVVAVPVSNYCSETPVTYGSTELKVIQPGTTYLKDGSMSSGEEKTKTEGINGEKNVKYKVTTKCNKEISKTVISEEQTKPTSDSIVLRGTKRIVSENAIIPFTNNTEYTSTLDKGVSQLKTAGVNGSKQVTFEISQNEGEAEVKKAVNEKVLVQPTNQVTYIGTKVKSNCSPNYSGCVPIASDVDCAGGSGNGPAYIYGPVQVLGYDIYGLDRDGDGYGCE